MNPKIPIPKNEGRDSITVKKVNTKKGFVFDDVKPGKTIVLKEDADFTLDVIRYTAKSKGQKKKYYKAKIQVHFCKGLCTDGATTANIPIINKVLPPYKQKDNVYNAAPFIHDGLYMKTGKIDGATLSKEECDDILRGIWRESKEVNRRLAGLADKAVELFAGSDAHWKYDESKNCKLFSAKLTYLD